MEAADGYRAVIALPELDPDFTDTEVVQAYLQGGKPLDDKARLYRIVIPEAKRMARWVRQVTKLKIVDVQQDSVLWIITSLRFHDGEHSVTLL